MPVLSASRLRALTRRLLGASTLCAIATVSPGGRAHVNTAYFAWADDYEIVWISEPDTRHSRNLAADPTAAIAVYDSHQVWGRPDRGVQLFGRAREVRGASAREAAALYARRFREYDPEAHGHLRHYRFRPSRIKLFEERLRGSSWVTLRVRAGGRFEQISEERA